MARRRSARAAVVLTISSAALIVVSVIVLFAIFVVLRAYFIPSEGMTPTLERSSTVWTMPATGSDVQRNDIIVFANPEPSTARGADLLVKRVVAVAGDTVEYRGGHLLVNGQQAREDFLAAGTSTRPLASSVADAGGATPSAVPAGTVYVLGDNRANSKDSRFFGPIANADVQRRVVAVTSSSTTTALRLGAVAGVVVGAIGLIAGVIWLLASRKPDSAVPGPWSGPAA